MRGFITRKTSTKDGHDSEPRERAEQPLPSVGTHASSIDVAALYRLANDLMLWSENDRHHHGRDFRRRLARSDDDEHAHAYYRQDDDDHKNPFPIVGSHR